MLAGCGNGRVKTIPEIPEELKERWNSIEDIGILKRCLKLAAKAGSMAAFQEAVSEQKRKSEECVFV